MSVRPCGPDRAAALAALHARAFDAPWPAKAVADLFASPGVIAAEAEHGFVMARLLGEEAEILTLAVDRDARRQGTGRALLQAAVAAAEAARARVMFLEVAADNAAALALYQGEGFVADGLRRGYYDRRGAAVDAVLMRRALNSAGP